MRRKITPSNPTGMTPPDNNIRTLQARRRGIRVIGTDENRPRAVVEFPLRRNTPASGADDQSSSQDKVCDSGTATASPDRSPKGLDNVSARTGRTARSTTVGVLMPSLELSRPISGRRPNDIGVLTHAIVQILAPHVRDIPPVLIPEKVLDVASALVDIPRVSERRALITTASGNACVYLRRLSPIDWDLVGCEFVVGNGNRVDVAYRHPIDGRVFFDEIKTAKWGLTRPTNEHLAQCDRYRAAGVTEFGAPFQGVRLLYVGALNASRLITPAGEVVRFAPTVDAPFGDTIGARA